MTLTILSAFITYRTLQLLDVWYVKKSVTCKNEIFWNCMLRKNDNSKVKACHFERMTELIMKHGTDNHYIISQFLREKNAENEFYNPSHK